MDALTAFEALSSEVGIVLPDLLKKLLASGTTNYGSEWRSTWRERTLQGAAPLSSCYDFEWLDAAQARQEIERWINPTAQHGKTFLPFAQSGAGDVYCLMPMDDQSIGVALIYHDEETSQIGYPSFDAFVVSQFLKAFSDLEHLKNNFTEAEILQCITSDVWFVTEFMNKQVQDYLRAFCQRSLIPRPLQYGPSARPKNVLSLISQEQLKVELAKYPAPNIAPFKIVASWEIDSPGEAAPAEHMVDWRTYALDPKKKLLAMQTCSKAFGITLAEAKLVIDRYVQDFTKNT